MTKSASKNREREPKIKDLGETAGTESVLTREQSNKNGQVRKKTGRPTQLSTGKAWRRRNDVHTSIGLVREHGRLLSAMHSGRIGLEAGEILSRTYSRQREHVLAVEQTAYLQRINEQLGEMRRELGLRTVSVVDYNAAATVPALGEVPK